MSNRYHISYVPKKVDYSFLGSLYNHQPPPHRSGDQQLEEDTQNQDLIRHQTGVADQAGIVWLREGTEVQETRVHSP